MPNSPEDAARTIAGMRRHDATCMVTAEERAALMMISLPWPADGEHAAAPVERRKGERRTSHRMMGNERANQWVIDGGRSGSDRRTPSSRPQQGRTIEEQARRELGEARVSIAQLEQDCLTFALRLAAEPETSHAPETAETLSRWMPAVYATLAGEPRKSAARLGRAALRSGA